MILTTPILVGTDGAQRMSKSLGNYIGVSEPPNIMYEKLMRVPDSALKSFVDLCLDESEERSSRLTSLKDAQSVREAGIRNPKGADFVAIHGWLATQVVRMYHGAEAAECAAAAYSTSGDGVASNVRKVNLPATSEETTWVGYLAVKSGLCKSTSEARRLLEQQGFHRMGPGIVAGQEVWIPVSPDLQVPSQSGAPDFFLRKGKRQETTVRIAWV